ncbi:hypothetical protein ALC60_08365 [Trachymyrmex zeteki]|uniref:Uncharacterized protein n=1 Tax=Mycetomoellerius zeteki TaxID=64791 RepID=A0A151WXU6_9HYME|nr:hypothetical protein ALC60_08365 [Trachymyrmex zeteki]
MRRTKLGAIARSGDPPLAPTGSLTIQTAKRRGAERKEDKRIYLPVQARISASSKISGYGQIVSTALIRFTIL